VETTVTRDGVLYLYGFVPAATDVSTVTAVEQDADTFLVPLGEIACAASAVPAHAYRRPPDESSPAEQLEWVTPRAWRHHQVLRRLHHTATVVPLKFGTLCADATQARALLRDHHAAIAALLAAFRGKDEWTLNTIIDEPALTASLVAADPQLVALEQEAMRLPPGRAYFARKKLQQVTADRIRERRQDAHGAAWRSAVERGLACVPREQGNGTLPLLIERTRFAELEVALAELEDAHAASHVRFELVGPWPPYSFTGTLEGA